MLAELVDHVIGVDPDRDWITVAALDSRTAGVITTDRFPATRDGYQDAIAWADAHTVESERVWVIEGTASYGPGLTMALQRLDELAIEFDRPMREATKDGAKSDAIRAAREALGRDKLNQPRTNDGIREAIRVQTVARAAATRAHTAAVNELKAIIVTVDEQLRSELRGLRTAKIGDPLLPIPRQCKASDRRALHPQRDALPRTPGPAPRSRDRRTRRSDEDTHRSSRPAVDCRARCRLCHRCSVLSRLVTPRSLPQRSRVPPTRRHRAHRGHLRPEPRPASPQPRW
jgi:hypothetical protein